MPKGDQAKEARAKWRTSDIPLLEWVIGGIGLLIVASTIGFMIYDAVAGDRSPPDLTVEVETISMRRNGYLVSFRAANEGGQTAAEVLIEGTLSSTDSTEKSEVVLEFVPPRSERRGGLLFQGDPHRGQLQLRAAGYREP
ncbi:MAG: TIGR02588 family protein [Verrucomicrobiales bacterium]